MTTFKLPRRPFLIVSPTRIVPPIFLAVATMLAVACQESYFTGGRRAGTGSPGQMIRVERRNEVKLRGEPKPTLLAPRGQTLLLVSFEGKREVRFDSKGENYPLVDKAGREYPLYFAGSPAPQGGLTCEGWEFEGGGRLSMGGRWAYSGVARLPDPRVVFVYVVPEQAEGLSLVEGERSIALEEASSDPAPRRGK